MTYELAYPDDDRYGPHQLRTLKGGRYTSEMHGPKGTDVGTLPVEFEPTLEFGEPTTITHSGWMPNEEQQRQLSAGAHIRLSVWQHPIPPLAVGVEGPVCQCHDQEMVWDRDEDDEEDPGGYVCRHFTEGPMRGTAVSDDALDQAKRDFEPEG